MSDRRDRKRWRTAAAPAIASLALHLLIGVPIIVLLARGGGSEDMFTYEPPPIEPYQLVLEREEEEPPDRERQIVSIDAPETEEVPDDADYEDRVNRSVEEETRARRRGQGYEAQPVVVRRSDARMGQERPVEEAGESGQREPGDDNSQGVEEDLAAVFEPREGGPGAQRLARADDANDQRRETDVPGDSRLELSAYAPSLETASDFIAVPGAPSIDHLDLPQGERDQLNSIENMYWSYWDRIKNQVRPHWRPARTYRDRDPTGRVFGVEDRYTVLRVTLNGDGTLRHVYLERTSDLDFLDREAIRAIRAAQPFANVPEGLKDDRGLLSFRFGFYFEVSSSSFRIRREDW